MMGNLGAEEVKSGRVVEISPRRAVELGGKCILEFDGVRVVVMDFACGLWCRNSCSEILRDSGSFSGTKVSVSSSLRFLFFPPFKTEESSVMRGRHHFPSCLAFTSSNANCRCFCSSKSCNEVSPNLALALKLLGSTEG